MVGYEASVTLIVALVVIGVVYKFRGRFPKLARPKINGATTTAGDPDQPPWWQKYVTGLGLVLTFVAILGLLSILVPATWSWLYGRNKDLFWGLLLASALIVITFYLTGNRYVGLRWLAVTAIVLITTVGFFQRIDWSDPKEKKVAQARVYTNKSTVQRVTRVYPSSLGSWQTTVGPAGNCVQIGPFSRSMTLGVERSDLSKTVTIHVTRPNGHVVPVVMGSPSKNVHYSLGDYTKLLACSPTKTKIFVHVTK